MDKMCFGVGVVVGGLLPAAAVAIAGFRTGAALIMGVLLIIQAIAVLGIMYILLAQVGALDHGGMLK